MKFRIPLLFALTLGWSLAALAQTPGAAVRKDPATGEVTESLAVGAGKALTVKTGSTLTIEAGATFAAPPSIFGSGAALQVLRRNAGNTTWEWATPAGGGDLLSTNNLSELVNPASARANLGLVIGTNVQAYAPNLTSWASIAPSAKQGALPVVDATSGMPAVYNDVGGIQVGFDSAATAEDFRTATGTAPASRTIATTHSLTGGGNLTGDRTLSLVNDTASPGANKTYGTDGSGVRGWKDDPAGGGTEVLATFFFSGDGAVLTAQSSPRLPCGFAGTITGWLVSGDVSGTITVTIEKAAVGSGSWTEMSAIGERPALSSGLDGTDIALTTWPSTTFTATDRLRATITGTPATVTQVTIRLIGTKS